MNGDLSPDQSRQLWLVPSPGESAHSQVADVAVRLPTSKTYTYAVPPGLADAVRPGALVRVPYGRSSREVEGVCVRVSRRAWDHTQKAIRSSTPGPIELPEPLAQLGLWISEYYVCPPGTTFAMMLPSALRRNRTRRVAWLKRTDLAAPDGLNSRAEALIAALQDGSLPVSDARKRAGVGTKTITTLIAAGLLERFEAPRPDAPQKNDAIRIYTEPQVSEEDHHALTAPQAAALGAISAAEGRFEVFLLFGVPGSGKTEVYVRAIRRVIAAGKQAILLTPEIALATQILDRLVRRFERVAVLHSQLTPATRASALRAIAAGEIDVVIGTRNAVFAPCTRLGLILVDEEQEGSFKSLAAPYFHARDVAVKRGQIESVPVVLGSATPALETWHNAAVQRRYTLLRLPERVPGAGLPEVRLVRAGVREGDAQSPILSRPLLEALRSTLAAGQQVILLHNRRGYATLLRCEQCGLALRCDQCGFALVFHAADDSVKCHQCGRKKPAPVLCDDAGCGGSLARIGQAIERLEEELRREAPAARLQRLDSDTMRRRADYEEALRRFTARETDVLLGTQMVAKGLDFPDVRLVGVIDADAALALPDFRAGELVFQLVMQVVGRAGRREGSSLAIVQTRDEPPRIVQDAIRMDFETFAAREMAAREALGFPPVTRMARLVFADARPHRAREAAERASESLRRVAGRTHPQIRVEPAEPCVIARLREMNRSQVLIRAPRGGILQQLLHRAMDEKALSLHVKRLTIDVDPIDLM